jgi:hypothetical protein
MRSLVHGILAAGWLALMAAPLLADPWPPPFPVTETPEFDTRVPVAPWSSPELDKAYAGLSKDSRPEVLVWKRVFALALNRFHAGNVPAAESLIPTERESKPKKSDVSDFDAFRTDFLAARGEGRSTFRDPSALYYQILRRLQSIMSGRRDIAFHEGLSILMRELVQGTSSGLSQLDVDRVGAALERARQRLDYEVLHYRNDLDQMRVNLGLSPHAAVIPDRMILAAFEAAFESVDEWHRNPQRALDQLPKLIGRLPVLGNVIVGGNLLVEANGPDPSAIEAALTDAARDAIKNRGALHGGKPRGDADAQLELRIRRRLRHLLQMQRAYDGEKRSYVLAIRLKDQTFERVDRPASEVTNPRSPLLDALLDHQAEIRRVEARLVRLWTEHRADRLALYREIGVLPYNDWKSFYDDLSAVAAEKPEPGVNQPAQEAGRQPPRAPEAGPPSPEALPSVTPAATPPPAPPENPPPRL